MIPIVLVDLGLPDQTVRLAIDTGSDVTWVAGVQVKETHPNFFHVESSFTFTPLHPAITDELNYFDGTNVKCTYGLETVAIGQISKSNTPLCVAYESNDAMSETVDGILAIPSPYSTHQRSAFLSLVNMFDRKCISIWYDQLQLSENQELNGIVSFGGDSYKKADYIGRVVLMPDPKYWAIRLTFLSIGDSFHLQVSDPNLQRFVVDTASSLTLLHPHLFEEANTILQTTFFDGHYLVDCKQAKNYPKLRLVFDTISLTLEGHELYHMHDGACMSMIVPSNDATLSILGGSILRHVVTTFSYDGYIDFFKRK